MKRLWYGVAERECEIQMAVYKIYFLFKQVKRNCLRKTTTNFKWLLV